jgi:hypothetical protein
MGRRPVTPQARRCGTFAAPGATSSPERGVAEAPCPTGAIVVEPKREAPRRAQSGLVRGGRREPISRQPPRADLPRDLPTNSWHRQGPGDGAAAQPKYRSSQTRRRGTDVRNHDCAHRRGHRGRSIPRAMTQRASQKPRIGLWLQCRWENGPAASEPCPRKRMTAHGRDPIWVQPNTSGSRAIARGQWQAPLGSSPGKPPDHGQPAAVLALVKDKPLKNEATKHDKNSVMHP